jgi:hypothetical protein
MMIIFTAVPVAQARSRSTAVTTKSVSYRFDAQLVQGSYAGSSVQGWLSGTLDSTGILTATITTDVLTPLKAGCAPYVDFGPACGLPPEANVSGKIAGSGASASVTLTATGKGWTWTLAGGAAGASGAWAGTLSRGSAPLGTWMLTPQPTTLHIDVGIKSAAKSKDKIVLVGAIDLQITADGWAIGTFSPINGTLPAVVQGFVNAKNSSAQVSIPMGAKGSVLLTGYSSRGFGVLKWSGTFAGPATGDYGAWSGQG